MISKPESMAEQRHIFGPPQLSPLRQQHLIPLQVVQSPVQSPPGGVIGLKSNLHLYLVIPQAVQESLTPFVQLLKFIT